MASGVGIALFAQIPRLAARVIGEDSPRETWCNLDIHSVAMFCQQGACPRWCDSMEYQPLSEWGRQRHELGAKMCGKIQLLFIVLVLLAADVIHDHSVVFIVNVEMYPT